MKVSHMVSELETQTVGLLGWLQFTQWHHSVKTVNGVMVLNRCKSYDDVFFIFVQSYKNITRVSELLRSCSMYTEIFKGA